MIQTAGAACPRVQAPALDPDLEALIERYLEEVPRYDPEAEEENLAELVKGSYLDFDYGDPNAGMYLDLDDDFTIPPAPGSLDSFMPDDPVVNFGRDVLKAVGTLSGGGKPYMKYIDKKTHRLKRSWLHLGLRYDF